MSFDQIVGELRKLSRAEKLRAMQLIVADLAAEEETALVHGATYTIETPLGNEAAAQILQDFLESSKKLTEE